LVEGWVAGWFPDPSPLRRRIPAGRCGTPQIGPFGVPMRERLREAVLRCPPRRRTSPRGRGGAGKPPRATAPRLPRQRTALAAPIVERRLSSTPSPPTLRLVRPPPSPPHPPVPPSLHTRKHADPA